MCRMQRGSIHWVPSGSETKSFLLEPISSGGLVKEQEEACISEKNQKKNNCAHNESQSRFEKNSEGGFKMRGLKNPQD